MGEVDDHPADDLTSLHLVDNVINFAELPGMNNGIDAAVSGQLKGFSEILPCPNQGTDNFNPVEDSLGDWHIDVSLW